MIRSTLLSTLSSVNTPSHSGLNYRGCAGGGSQVRSARGRLLWAATYLGDGLHRIRYNVTARGVYNLTVRADLVRQIWRAVRHTRAT